MRGLCGIVICGIALAALVLQAAAVEPTDQLDSLAAAAAEPSKQTTRRPWVGSVNATHAVDYPENAKKGMPQAHKVDRRLNKECKTQVEVLKADGTKLRNYNTCTSCNDDKALMVIYHKARAGFCRPYDTAPAVVTARLDVVRVSRNLIGVSNSLGHRMLVEGHRIPRN